jgi:hypothetical protein
MAEQNYDAQKKSKEDTISVRHDKQALSAQRLECKHCRTPFLPRQQTGGKPQQCCSPACRFAFRQRGQRAQRDGLGATCNWPSAEPSTATHFDPQNDPSEQRSWSIEPQAEVCVLAVNDGSIEIEQKSPMGKDENQRVFVAAQNAVRLARLILLAAGFKNIVISSGLDGGVVNLEDGYGPLKVRE